ncbi:branched-chain amino acid ABC transporter permease [Halorutilales archaeon Cl-col2-1]
MNSTREALAEALDDDAVKIAAMMFGIYVVYTVIGGVLGLSTNGIANTLRRVTFLTSVYAMLTLALNLQWGYAGLFNIGVTGFMAVGIYTTAIFTRPSVPAAEEVPLGFGVPGLGMPLIVGIVAGMVASAVLGFLVALPALRLRADYLAIVTVGLAEILRLSFKSDALGSFTLLGTRLGTGGGNGIATPENPVRLIFYKTAEGAGEPNGFGASVFSVMESVGIQSSVVVSWAYVVVLAVFVGAIYWLAMRVGFSPFGRVLKAVREDEDVARALGKNTDVFKIKIFMLGCALMGLAGILWRGSQGRVYPDVFQPEFTFYVWVALIIGGSSSNTGSVLGAAVFSAGLWEGPRYLNKVVTNVFEIGSPPSAFDDAVAPILSLDFAPFVAYVVESLRGTLRLVIMGVILIWLMQRHPEGLLGHRKEEASAVDLSVRKGGGDVEGGGDT